MAIEIPVGKYVALVDEADAELVRQYKWSLLPNRKSANLFYVKTGILVNGKRTTVTMHRLILGLTVGDPRLIDHRNLNGLDNRRENLRLATRHQQNANTRKKRGRNGPSGTQYKGVYRCTDRAKYQAECNREWLGRFDTAEQAALAYNRRAVEIFGSFARLNEMPAP